MTSPREPLETLLDAALDIGHEIPDGREDCHVFHDGKPVLTLTQEDWRALGLTYDEAKRFITVVTALLAGVAQKEPRP